MRTSCCCGVYDSGEAHAPMLGSHTGRHGNTSVLCFACLSPEINHAGLQLQFDRRLRCLRSLCCARRVAVNNSAMHAAVGAQPSLPLRHSTQPSQPDFLPPDRHRQRLQPAGSMRAAAAGSGGAAYTGDLGDMPVVGVLGGGQLGKMIAISAVCPLAAPPAPLRPRCVRTVHAISRP